MTRVHWSLLGLLSTLACTTSVEGGERLEVARFEATTRETARLELISAANCQPYGDRLQRCEVPESTLVDESTEAAVPVRTVVSRVIDGNCSTPYPLELELAGDALPEARRFPFLSQDLLVLRGRDGAPLRSLTVKDVGAWTRHSSFHKSCEITLVVSQNEPDVDTPAHARALLAAIESELLRSRAELRAYEELRLFLGAHAFLATLAERLHEELTSELMQELRRAYRDALPGFRELAGSGSCKGELGGRYVELLELGSALSIVGEPEDWENPDGSVKTLADLYADSSGAGAILRLEELVLASDPGLEEEYEALHAAAAERVAEGEARLEQARGLLAPWMEE